jgi:hypothetical protein
LYGNAWGKRAGELSYKKVPPHPFKEFYRGYVYGHREQRLRGSKLRAYCVGPFPLRSRMAHKRHRAAHFKAVAGRSHAAPRPETQTIAPQSKIRPMGLAAELITASCDNNHPLITLTSDPTANRTAPCYLSGNAGGALYPNMDAAPSVGGSERGGGVRRGSLYAVWFLLLGHAPKPRTAMFAQNNRRVPVRE